jgi:hypothetical protein
MADSDSRREAVKVVLPPEPPELAPGAARPWLHGVHGRGDRPGHPCGADAALLVRELFDPPARPRSGCGDRKAEWRGGADGIAAQRHRGDGGREHAGRA